MYDSNDSAWRLKGYSDSGVFSGIYFLKEQARLEQRFALTPSGASHDTVTFAVEFADTNYSATGNNSSSNSTTTQVVKFTEFAVDDIRVTVATGSGYSTSEVRCILSGTWY